MNDMKDRASKSIVEIIRLPALANEKTSIRTSRMNDLKKHTQKVSYRCKFHLKLNCY